MTELQWNKAFALEQTAGDEELLEELLILFKESSEADFQQLQDAAEKQDFNAMVSASHSIKGAAASLGITGISSVAMAIENAAREKKPEGMEEKIIQLGTLLTEFSGLV